jgi:HD-like signal output (HDOD) protein/tRNA A-37 threonylcarbamoyl transferase component Bud32
VTTASSAFPGHQTYGPYRVLGVLGEGGMGRVYLAEHTVIGRRVAVKVLAREVATEPEIISRFFVEARAVNAIRHPNIVEVTDFGTSEGQPYIVMEYLEGETLADRLRWQGPLLPEALIRIGRQIASALGAVHERGIVHRDLKPANIFLREHPDYPDFVKILDFGIAKLMEREGADTAPRTRVGMAMGTPTYMSPEQCLGDLALDVRSDIYSFGVVLFEMATGAPPFTYDAPGRLFLAHIQEPPADPRAVRADVSPGLAALVLRALAKDPADRFASMREVRDALEALIWPAPAVAPPVPASPSRNSGAANPSPVTVPLRVVGGRGPIRRSRPAPALAPAAATALVVDLEAPRLVTLVGMRIGEGALEAPPLPAVVALGLEMTQSPAFAFPAAVEVARRDPRLASLVIRTANVEPYGGRAPAMNLEQGIARLGAQGLAIALVELIARPVLEARAPRLERLFRRPWAHALAGAYIARRLAREASTRTSPAEEPQLAYIAALLRDIGQALVATVVLEIERRSPEHPSRRPLPEAAFVACIEAHHARVRRDVAAAWRQPAVVVDALSEAPATEAGVRLAAIVRLAATLADLEGFGLRRDDQTLAAAALAEARAAVPLDDAGLSRARGKVKEWVLARA